LPFSLSIIILAVGVSIYLKIDLILSSMIMGAVLANLAPLENEEISAAIKRFSTPFYVLFFVLVGARIDLGLFLGSGIALLVIVYVLARSAGKISGAFIGGSLGGAHAVVRRYLGVCLFSQAGVAVGLAIAIQQSLSHLGPEATQIGQTILNIIVASTFIVQIVGPPSVRWAVHRADEVWRDITEEDVIGSYSVEKMMEKDIPLIKENATLHSIIETIKESDSYYFCVVNDRTELLGVISLGDLRSVFLEKEIELSHLILAKDIVLPAHRVGYGDEPLAEAIGLFRRKEFDFLPILKKRDSRELAGVLHYRVVMLRISEELLLRRDKLG